jgi:hypothetical protein
MFGIACNDEVANMNGIKRTEVQTNMHNGPCLHGFNDDVFGFIEP